MLWKTKYTAAQAVKCHHVQKCIFLIKFTYSQNIRYQYLQLILFFLYFTQPIDFPLIWKKV